MSHFLFTQGLTRPSITYAAGPILAPGYLYTPRPHWPVLLAPDGGVCGSLSLLRAWYGRPGRWQGVGSPIRGPDYTVRSNPPGVPSKVFPVQVGNLPDLSPKFRSFFLGVKEKQGSGIRKQRSGNKSRSMISMKTQHVSISHVSTSRRMNTFFYLRAR